MQRSLAFILAAACANIIIPAYGQIVSGFPTGYGWVMPRASQQASITQQVGVTEITIEYSRPAVNQRTVWGGELVPYGEVWRIGANEATTISFSTEVKVNGEAVPAGRYALFVLPEADGPWMLILNKRWDQWGAFTYNQAEDLLRVPVASRPVAEHRERLEFSFPEVTDSTAHVEARWEKRVVPFTVTVDAFATAAEKAANTFDWRAAWFAANYLRKDDAHLGEALRWARIAVAADENAANLIVEGKILARLGRFGEAVPLAERAAQLADFDQIRESAEALAAVWKEKSDKRPE